MANQPQLQQPSSTPATPQVKKWYQGQIFTSAVITAITIILTTLSNTWISNNQRQQQRQEDVYQKKILVMEEHVSAISQAQEGIKSIALIRARAAQQGVFFIGGSLAYAPSDSFLKQNPKEQEEIGKYTVGLQRMQTNRIRMSIYFQSPTVQSAMDSLIKKYSTVYYLADLALGDILYPKFTEEQKKTNRQVFPTGYINQNQVASIIFRDLGPYDEILRAEMEKELKIKH